jgi:hypothetical protein
MPYLPIHYALQNKYKNTVDLTSFLLIIMKANLFQSQKLSSGSSCIKRKLYIILHELFNLFCLRILNKSNHKISLRVKTNMFQEETLYRNELFSSRLV